MKSLLTYKSILTVAFFILAMTHSYILFAQCNQNNFTVTGFQLRNQNGQQFTVTDNFELGQAITGELWVNFGGSTTNGYNMLMFYDVFQNGTRISDDQYDCLFSGIQVVQNTWVKVRNLGWNWGDVIEIKDIFMYWETGTAKSNTTCKVSTKNNINSQCYGNSSGFTAAVPLFPKFDFDSNGVCNTTIQFTSQTIGGTPPFNYSYSWDFDNNGVFDSTQEDPLFNFPGSGTYPIKLRVNDGTSITTIVKNIYIDPNFGINVTIFPTKVNDTSGIIYVESVTGGTEPYNFQWSGPNGFSSNSRDIFNLSDGTYTLTVSDDSGCQQTVQYIMDIAMVLSVDWKTVEVTNEKNQIRINWEISNEAEDCDYVIERSYAGVDNFKPIGTVKGKGKAATTWKYSFTDVDHASYENSFYYRIAQKTSSGIVYSPIKMIQKEVTLKNESAWHAFPNPSTDGRIYLKNLDGENRVKVQLELITAGQISPPKEVVLDNSGIIDLGNLFGPLPKGISILKIMWGTNFETMKLIGK